MFKINKNNDFSNKMILSLNPSLLMEFAFNIKPDKWQADLLSKQPDQSLLLCSRQSGKSTVCAVLALYHAAFKKESLVLIISKAFRQAEKLFRKVKYGLPVLFKSKDIIRENQSTLELSNGSRIISLPGKEDSIRSFSSVSLLIIDEAAQVSDELYATVRPMLAVSRGKIIALSTPYGKRGWFFNSWTNDNNWYKIKITADDCPRITQEFIKQEREEVGDWWIKQEYFCEFVETEDQIFSYEMVESMIKNDVKSWDSI